jgi:hypothetical protein
MKKSVFIIIAVLGFTLKSKATFTVTVQPNVDPQGKVVCAASAPFWTSGGGFDFCCTSISCSNGYGVTVCNILALLENAPDGNSEWSSDVDIKIQKDIELTPQVLAHYKNFENAGHYDFDRDEAITDIKGNVVIYKAGRYFIKKGKLTVMINKKSS